MEPILEVAAAINKSSSDAADALANPESAAEQTAVIQTLPALTEGGEVELPKHEPNLANKIKAMKLGGKRKTRKNLRRRRA